MTDVFDELTRSRIMRNIKSKNTSIEIIIRKIIFSLGYRYRIHYKKLPGNPDIVFPGRKKVIFIHGCFWHQHAGCRKCKRPNSRTDFWNKKLDRNIERDKLSTNELLRLEWKYLIIWQCEIKKSNINNIVEKIINFLDAENKNG